MSQKLALIATGALLATNVAGVPIADAKDIIRPSNPGVRALSDPATGADAATGIPIADPKDEGPTPVVARSAPAPNVSGSVAVNVTGLPTADPASASLTVGPNADGTGAATITVQLVPSKPADNSTTTGSSHLGVSKGLGYDTGSVWACCVM